jgi:VWFA-related protein
MKILLTSTLLTALAAIGAAAQTVPAKPAPSGGGDQTTFKAGGEEVVLDVVVRDKKGRLVKDLKQSDFTVIDNGEQRAVKSFRVVEGTDAISSSGARSQLDPLRQFRLITLVFQGGDINQKKLARDAALELVKTELAQNVFVSVMAIDHRLQAIQPFTNDRDLIKKGIARATATVNDYTGDTIQVRNQLEQMLGPSQGGDTSTVGRVANMPTGGAAGSSGAAAAGTNGGNIAMAQLMLNILQNAQSDESSDWARASVYPLLDLIKEQYRLPGRKTIMYFSGGFPLTQSVEQPFAQIISIANHYNVSFYCIDTRGLTTYSTNSGAVDALRDAAGASKAGSTSSSGVNQSIAQSVDKSYDAGKSDTQNTIERLAQQTGGVLIANTNDFRAPIRKVLEDAQSYYELTYDPQIQKYDGAFRKVAVKMDSADLRVQSRAGYFALPPHLVQSGQVVVSYEVPLLQALEEKPLPHNFPFQSAAMHFRGKDIDCEIVVDIPVAGLTLEENKTAGYFEGKLAYVAVLKDGEGTVVKKLRQEVPLRVTPDKLAAYKASSHFIYNEGFNVPPGRYTLETAVIDMPSQKISARKSVFVLPEDKGGILGISSVTLIRNTKAKDAAVKPEDPMLMTDKVIMPMVNPILKKTEYDSIPFYVTLYPDPNNTEKPSLRMEFSKDGTMLGGGSAPIGGPDEQGRIQYVANAPLASLPPGNYEVKFVAKQGLETATENVSFSVEP